MNVNYENHYKHWFTGNMFRIYWMVVKAKEGGYMAVDPQAHPHPTPHIMISKSIPLV